MVLSIDGNTLRDAAVDVDGGPDPVLPALVMVVAGVDRLSSSSSSPSDSAPEST